MEKKTLIAIETDKAQLVQEFTEGFNDTITKVIMGEKLSSLQRADAIRAMILTFIALTNLEDNTAIILMHEATKSSIELMDNMNEMLRSLKPKALHEA